MTRRAAVFTVLRENVNEWVPGAKLVEAGGGWRFGGRIEELRKAGHTILSEPDPDSSVWRYKLVIPEVAPGQGTLWAA